MITKLAVAVIGSITAEFVCAKSKAVVWYFGADDRMFDMCMLYTQRSASWAREAADAPIVPRFERIGYAVIASAARRSRGTKGARRLSGSPRRFAARDDGACGDPARVQ